MRCFRGSPRWTISRTRGRKLSGTAIPLVRPGMRGEGGRMKAPFATAQHPQVGRRLPPHPGSVLRAASDLVSRNCARKARPGAVPSILGAHLDIGAGGVLERVELAVAGAPRRHLAAGILGDPA